MAMEDLKVSLEENENGTVYFFNDLNHLENFINYMCISPSVQEEKHESPAGRFYKDGSWFEFRLANNDGPIPKEEISRQRKAVRDYVCGDIPADVNAYKTYGAYILRYNTLSGADVDPVNLVAYEKLFLHIIGGFMEKFPEWCNIKHIYLSNHYSQKRAGVHSHLLIDGAVNNVEFVSRCIDQMESILVEGEN